VVYNGVHMMTGETDEAGRDAWIASLDKVADLNPKIVVAGHSRIVNQGGSVADIAAEMLKLHGNRDNPRTLWYSARLAVDRRD
jgi:hypothetical protein